MNKHLVDNLKYCVECDRDTIFLVNDEPFVLGAINTITGDIVPVNHNIRHVTLSCVVCGRALAIVPYCTN
jgi:hypothetical protein